MHLIGSTAEDQFRKELEASRTALMHGSDRADLRAILKQRNADIARALVVDWIPEQGEDFYEVLLDSVVLHIEIPHDGSPRAIQSIPLTDYVRRRHGRPKRIRLAVALDMLEKGSCGDVGS